MSDSQPIISPDGKLQWNGTNWVPLSPAASQISPDGKFQWDGFRWVPMPQVAPQVSPGEYQWDGTRWVPRSIATPARSKKRPALVIGIIVGALVLIGLGSWVVQATKPPDCTIGYSNSNLNIEVSGQGADAACRQLMPAGPGANADGFPYGTGHLSQPSGDVACQVTLHGLSYTVRDRGLVTLYGPAACASLRSEVPHSYKSAPQVAFEISGSGKSCSAPCRDGADPFGGSLSPSFTPNGDWDLSWSYQCATNDHYFYVSVRDGDGKTQAYGDFTQPSGTDQHGSGVMHAHEGNAGPRVLAVGGATGCDWTIKVTLLGPRA